MDASQAWIDRKIGQQVRLSRAVRQAAGSETYGEMGGYQRGWRDAAGANEKVRCFQRALDSFGRDNFALVMVGHEVRDLWLGVS